MFGTFQAQSSKPIFSKLAFPLEFSPILSSDCLPGFDSCFSFTFSHIDWYLVLVHRALEVVLSYFIISISYLSSTCIHPCTMLLQPYTDFFWFFLNTIFVSSHMYPENHEGPTVIVGSMNMGYISDAAKHRTHNLLRPKREPIPLGHSDGQSIDAHRPHFLFHSVYSPCFPWSIFIHHKLHP